MQLYYDIKSLPICCPLQASISNLPEVEDAEQETHKNTSDTVLSNITSAGDEERRRFQEVQEELESFKSAAITERTAREETAARAEVEQEKLRAEIVRLKAQASKAAEEQKRLQDVAAVKIEVGSDAGGIGEESNKVVDVMIDEDLVSPVEETEGMREFPLIVLQKDDAVLQVVKSHQRMALGTLSSNILSRNEDDSKEIKANKKENTTTRYKSSPIDDRKQAEITSKEIERDVPGTPGTPVVGLLSTKEIKTLKSGKILASLVQVRAEKEKVVKEFVGHLIKNEEHDAFIGQDTP